MTRYMRARRAYYKQMMSAPKSQAAQQHGTASGYINRGCRCDACRTAAREYQRARRLRHQAEQLNGGGTDAA
jgi:hypothetical protein